MRRRRGLSVASKILGRGASSSPPPFQFPCLRTTPTTPTRSTMSTHCSAQSGRTRALAPRGRPWPLDRLKVNHAWFLFAISPLPPQSIPPLSLYLSPPHTLCSSPSRLSITTGLLSFCDLTSFLHPSFRPPVSSSVILSPRPSVSPSSRPSLCVCVRLWFCFSLSFVVIVCSQVRASSYLFGTFLWFNSLFLWIHLTRSHCCQWLPCKVVSSLGQCLKKESVILSMDRIAPPVSLVRPTSLTRVSVWNDFHRHHAWQLSTLTTFTHAQTSLTLASLVHPSRRALLTLITRHSS